jgi:hypothetical protein
MKLKLLTAIALAVATLCISSTNAGKTGARASQDRPVFIPLSDGAKPNGFEAQMRGDEVVSMTVVKKNGHRLALKVQSKPPCSTSCPAGQKMSCWEDEKQQMSICVCGSPRNGDGKADILWRHTSGL